MRIKVTLNTPDETIININYNYHVSSMIYELLSKSNTQYSAKLHETGYMLGKRNFKLFTFSNLFPEKYRVENSNLIIQGKTALYISSPMNEFVLHLAEGLLATRMVRIATSRFQIETVEVMPQPEFVREMRFVCLSPLTTMTVEEKEGKRRAVPCMPGSGKFVENIKNNLLRKFYLINGGLPSEMSLEMEFSPEDLERYGKGKLIKFKEVFVKAYSIPFTIRGSVELIKTGYECGFGEKNPAGFGMVGVR